MNTSQVIEKVNRLKPNALTSDDFIDFINEIESEIAVFVTGTTFVPITNETLMDELLAPVPFERVYYEFISAKIDFLNGNIEAYSLSSNQFNSDFEDMKKYCLKSGITPLSNYTRTDYF